MKTTNLLKTIIASTMIIISFAANAQDRTIQYAELPDEIKTYIKTHFADNKFVVAEVERDGLSKEYEVTLTDNVKLEFNGKKQIKKIDGKTKLPDSVIPQPIINYVKSHYPSNFITEWELSKNRQSVELDNGLDLYFTIKGEFIKLDN